MALDALRVVARDDHVANDPCGDESLEDVLEERP
ncbi:MAG: hypothetical protein QOD06_1357, partial [Candidatus Binatota bacterium]|nr:hypothetical protein [Candidatus Binatota bacterium]